MTEIEKDTVKLVEKMREFIVSNYLGLEFLVKCMNFGLENAFDLILIRYGFVATETSTQVF